MKRRMSTLYAAFLTLALAAVTQALPSQTYVASTGDDANDCIQTTPCRTFAGAILKTAPKGIVTAVDSSSYGIVIIDKALTLQAAPGVYAVLEGGRTDDVVTINVGPTEVVALRNLHIFTRSLAANRGVLINSAGTLHVEGCLINGFGGAGILGGSCNETGCTQLFVVDTILRENVVGLKVGSARASIDHCRIEHNHTGVLVVAQAEVTVRDCVLAGNSDVGLKAEIFGGAKIENCVVSNNGTGIEGEKLSANGQNFFSEIDVSSTMIVSNGKGIFPNGGSLRSWGNNRLSFNLSNGNFTDQLAMQ